MDQPVTWNDRSKIRLDQFNVFADNTNVDFRIAFF